jgi:hypothetical protein
MENDLDLTDQFAMEIMKLILISDDSINYFIPTMGYKYYSLGEEGKKIFHANFAKICYSMAREMQKERLAVFK